MTKKITNSEQKSRSLPLVIVNPGSASGSTSKVWPSMAVDLRAHFGPFDAAFTEGPNHAIEIAEDAARTGYSFIIACGGDGTINEVANGIMRSGKDAELGLLPSGTGGDFRRTIGMPLHARDAAAALRTGRTRVIDVGEVAFLDEAGTDITRFFVNVSSVGLATSIISRVKSANGVDWLPAGAVRGRANYAISTLREVMDVEPFILNVRFDDGEKHRLQTINFCVANARYFGGGMKIAPDAKLSDGLLDVINIGDLSTAQIIANAYTLYRGSHLQLDKVKSTLAERIEVTAQESATEIRIETDGELPGKLPATFRAIPNALKIRVPA